MKYSLFDVFYNYFLEKNNESIQMEAWRWSCSVDHWILKPKKFEIFYLP